MVGLVNGSLGPFHIIALEPGPRTHNEVSAAPWAQPGPAKPSLGEKRFSCGWRNKRRLPSLHQKSIQYSC